MNYSPSPAEPQTNAGSGKSVTTVTVPVSSVQSTASGVENSVAPRPGEFTSYDPEAIEGYYGRRPLMLARRLIRVLWPFVLFYLGLLLDRLSGKSPAKQKRRAAQLREILTSLGPAYIKVGQALSTRPDLVPPVYLDEFTRLQDQLPPFANQLAYQFIREELGTDPSNVYADLSSSPVAAASLGQVYKGTLKTGEAVAVKVQRPDLAQRITIDIYILRQIAKWATKNIKQIRSDLVGIMDEFGARIFEEMDYTHEGENARRFAQLYGHLKDIYVPHIYSQYTGRRVLTMEWIEGTKLTKPLELQAQGIDASYLIEVGVQCSLRQLLEHGFFHADPHPGNLLATPDGKLAYLDFGMMSEVKPYQRYGLIEAIVHMVNRDFEGLAGDYVKLEFLTPDTDLSPIIPALSEVFSNALGASVAELNFKSITDEFSALMYEYPFRVPAYYALIIRSLVTLEGIAIGVDPDFKVLSKAYPYVAKRLLTDQSPELRSSLNNLLFKDGSFRWNRLENLLRNAKDSQDYDIDKVLDQTVDFLFSERGTFIRDRISDEVVNALDGLSRTALDNATHNLRQFQHRLGWPGAKPVAAPATGDPNDDTVKTAEHVLRILEILRDTEGFDPTALLPLVPKVLMKRETHQMGQRIAGGLAQRAVARVIRQVLLQNQAKPTQRQPALPSAS